MSARSCEPEAGFTLLEVLVAFLVLALMLGTLLSLNSRALDTTVRAGNRQEALLLAQSALDRVLADQELRAGTQRGRSADERYEWELEVRRFEFPDAEPGLDSGAPEPYEIKVSVTWGRNQSLILNTLRLVQTL